MSQARPRGELLRLLGLGFAVAVAVGEMIGSGILRTPSLVAQQVGIGAAILALWVFGAIHAALQANVLAELGTALPRVGGQYVFVRRAMGDIAGLIVGWTMWCAHIAGMAASAIAFADFTVPLIPAAAGHETGIAVGIQIVLYGANIMGLREGRAVQAVTSLLKATMLIAFAVAAILLMPVHTGPPPSPAAAVGFLGLAAAYQLIRGAYNGWHAPVYFTEESLTPGRSLPRALFLGIAFTAALYVLVNAALLHALGAADMATRALPFTIVLNRIAGHGAAVLFAIGALITVASCANANVMIAPRILFALSRDRLLPSALMAVNKGGSPYMGFALTAVLSIALSTTGGFRMLFGMIATLVTLASILTELALFVLRAREPQLERPYRAVLYPWLPGAAIVLDVVLLAMFARADLRGAAFAAMLCLLCVPFAIVARRAWAAP